MKKTLALVVSLFFFYVLFWWSLQIVLERCLSEVMDYHRSTVALQYETLHLDFLLRFVELTGVQIIPQKQELGVFLVSSLKLDNWGRKQGYWFATLTFQGVHVASTGTFKNILENLGYQDDALDTEAEITLAYDPTSQKLTVDFLQDTPQLGGLKCTTTLVFKTSTVTSLNLEYKEKTLLMRIIKRSTFAKNFSEQFQTYLALIPDKNISSPSQIQNFLMNPGEFRIRLRPKPGYSLLLQEILEADFSQLLPKLEAKIVLLPTALFTRSPSSEG